MSLENLEEASAAIGDLAECGRELQRASWKVRDAEHDFARAKDNLAQSYLEAAVKIERAISHAEEIITRLMQHVKEPA